MCLFVYNIVYLPKVESEGGDCSGLEVRSGQGGLREGRGAVLARYLQRAFFISFVLSLVFVFVRYNYYSQGGRPRGDTVRDRRLCAADFFCGRMFPFV